MENMPERKSLLVLSRTRNRSYTVIAQDWTGYPGINIIEAETCCFSHSGDILEFVLEGTLNTPSCGLHPPWGRAGMAEGDSHMQGNLCPR